MTGITAFLSLLFQSLIPLLLDALFGLFGTGAS